MGQVSYGKKLVIHSRNFNFKQFQRLASISNRYQRSPRKWQEYSTRLSMLANQHWRKSKAVLTPTLSKASILEILLRFLFKIEKIACYFTVHGLSKLKRKR